MPDVPVAIAQRAANAPLALAAFSLLAWALVTGLAGVRALGLVSLKNLSSPVQVTEVSGERPTVTESSTAGEISVDRNTR